MCIRDSISQGGTKSPPPLFLTDEASSLVWCTVMTGCSFRPSRLSSHPPRFTLHSWDFVSRVVSLNYLGPSILCTGDLGEE
eukprot:10521967-Alexandrium_andersonii.AAC.1